LNLSPSVLEDVLCSLIRADRIRFRIDASAGVLNAKSASNRPNLSEMIDLADDFIADVHSVLLRSSCLEHGLVNAATDEGGVGKAGEFGAGVRRRGKGRKRIGGETNIGAGMELFLGGSNTSGNPHAMDEDGRSSGEEDYTAEMKDEV